MPGKKTEKPGVLPGLAGRGRRVAQNPVLKWIPGLVGISLLLFLLHRANWSSLGDLASRMALLPLFLATCAGALNLLAAALRFRLLVDAPLGLGRASGIFLTGFLFNYLLIFPGFGSGVKVGLLWKDRVGLARSLAGVGGEVLLDILFCALAGVLFLALRPELLAFPLPDRPAWIVLALTAGGLGLLGVLFRAQSRRLAASLRSLFEAGRYLLRRRVLFQSAALTTVSWAFSAGTAALLFSALGASPPFFDVLGGVCIAALGGQASLIPAGLGVREGIWVYLFTRSGIEFSVCVFVALCQRVLFLFLALGGWAILRAFAARARERESR